MSIKERINFEIDILKTLLLAFLTAIFGIFAYCVINYKTIDGVQFVFIMLGLIILFAIIFITSMRIIKQLNKIEKE